MGRLDLAAPEGEPGAYQQTGLAGAETLGAWAPENQSKGPKRVSRKQASPRRGRRHKAWGFSPRQESQKNLLGPEGAQAAYGPIELPAPLRGLCIFFLCFPGAKAPGFMPTPPSGLAFETPSRGQ